MFDLPKERDNRLQLFASAPNKISANAYYRLEVPIRTARELELATGLIEGQDDAVVDAGQSLIYCCTSDIAMFLMVYSKTLLDNVKTIKKVPPAPDAYGVMCYPPSFVYDAEDNLDLVSPFNNAWAKLGTRGPNGEILPDEFEIRMKAADGEDVLLWANGMPVGDGSYINLSDNRARVDMAHQLAKECDGLSVTCQELGDWYRDNHGIENIYVFPNSIRFNDYLNVTQTPHDEIRILWQGGSSHWIDWYPLRDAVREISEKYSNVKWIMWGMVYPWVHKVIPKDRLVTMPWERYDRYLPRLALLDHDINLCPLVDNIFNRCKSGIKFYESSALTRPVCSLAANVGPYKEIIDGETGLLYDSPEEFKDKLCELIEHASLRKQLAAKANEWVHEYRDARKTVPPLVEWWKSMREKSGG